MEARQKTRDDMSPDEWQAVLAQVETFKQDHNAAEDPKCGILQLRNGAGKVNSPLPHQVVAANKLLQQDLTSVRKRPATGEEIGDPKPLDKRKASLLAIHDVGTGKTITGVLVMAGVHRLVQLAKQAGKDVNATKIMIIVPKSVLNFWYEKVQEWTTLGSKVVVVTEQKYTETPEGLVRFKNALVVITTPYVLKAAVRTSFNMPPKPMSDAEPLDKLMVRKPKLPPIHPLLSLLPFKKGSEPLLDESKPSPYALTIVDEAHLHTKPKTWTACAIALFTKNSVYKLGLTGTPVKRSPDEIAYLATILDVRMHKIGTQDGGQLLMHRTGYFGQKHGTINDEHLQKFQQNFVDRVDKKHIYPPLPTRHEVRLYYDPFIGLDNATGALIEGVTEGHNAVLAGAKQSQADQERDVTDTSNQEDDFPEAPEGTTWSPVQKNAFAAIIAIGNYEFSSVLGTHGATAFKDTPALYDEAERFPSQAMLLIERVVKDRQANGHVRIAVFAESVTQLKILRRHLEAKGIGDFFLFDGELDETERAEMVKNFLKCEKGVIFLSKAGGVGITLCPGCEVMLSVGSLPWNATDVDQAFGRVHRIGQTKPVELIQLIARRSVTAAKYKLHQEKRDRLAAAVTNDDYTHFDVFSDAWRSTKDMLSYVAPLDTTTGNYTVTPGYMAEVQKYSTDMDEYTTKLLPQYDRAKARAGTSTVTLKEPKEPKKPTDVRFMGTPVLPSRLALPPALL